MLDEGRISPGMIIEVKNADQRNELISIAEKHGAITFGEPFNTFPNCIRLSAEFGRWAWAHEERLYYEIAYPYHPIYEFEDLETDDPSFSFEDFASMLDGINTIQ